MAFELTNPYTNQKSLSDYMLENAKARYASSQADSTDIANQAASAALPYAGSNAQQANQQTQMTTQAAQLQQTKTKNDALITELSQDHDPASWEAGKQRLAAAGIDTSQVGDYDPATQQQYLQKAIGVDKLLSSQLDIYGSQLKASMSMPQAQGATGPAQPPLLSTVMGAGASNASNAQQPPASQPGAGPNVQPGPTSAKPLSGYMSLPPATDPGAQTPPDMPTPAGTITGAIDQNSQGAPINTPQPSANGYAQVQQAAAKAGIPAPAQNSTLINSAASPAPANTPVAPAQISDADRYKPLSIGGKPMVEGAETGNQWYLDTQTGQKVERLAPGVAIFDPATAGNLHGDDYLKTLSPEKAGYIKGIADGDLPVPTSRGPAGIPAISDVMNAVKQYRPGFSASAADVLKSFRVGDDAPQIQTFNTVGPHLQTLAVVSKALANGDSQTLNEIKNSFQEQFGNAAPTNFNSVKQLAAAEVVKAVTGTGGTGGDRDEAEKAIDSANSPAQLQGVIDHYTKLMGDRVNASQQKYTIGTGRSDFANLLVPEAQQVFGIKPQGAPSQKPTLNTPVGGQSFKTATNPQTGAKMVFKGGQWQTM